MLAGPALASTPSKVQFLRNATASFDSYLNSPSPSRARFMRSHYAQMRGYAPYFDDHAFASWKPSPTSFSQNLFAIYHPSDDALAAAHPDWVLRDVSGDPLFLPSGCAGGTCPQYAADPGNAAWRQHWIDQARQTFQHAKAVSLDGKGYRGIFIDDVDLQMGLVTAGGTPATPVDPRTGGPMTAKAWQRYVVAFLQQIRAAFPNVEITHNAPWFVSQHDPYVGREVRSADVLELERGFNDPGLTAGRGKYSYKRFVHHIAWLHGHGASFVLEAYLSSVRQARYELANYFLVRKGKDAIATEFRANPANWWKGWSTGLGAPRGGHRSVSHGALLRRDFRRGSAIVNPPGGRAKTIRFSKRRRSLTGKRSRHFRLPSGTGDVFVRLH